MSREYKILFVCTGNTCRSYMAESIAKSYLAARSSAVALQISSAGTGCLDEEPASFQARRVMSELGCANDSHRARRVTVDMIKEADLLLTMTHKQREDILKLAPEAKNKVSLLKEYTGVSTGNNNLHNLDIMDPYGQSVDCYRSCAREIAELVSCVIDTVLKM